MPRSRTPKRQHDTRSVETLGLLVDEILRRDPSYRRASRRLRLLQGRLRRRCSPRAWRTYLRIEEESNDRLARAVDLVALRVAEMILGALTDEQRR